MAAKNLKVIMSGDTKPYREEVDKAVVATKALKNDIGGQLSQLSALFGIEIGTIGQSAQKVSLAFAGLTASMQKAAMGGTAAATANTQLTASTNAVASAEARLLLANEALIAAQTGDAVTAEALAAAELEAAGAAAALSTAQKGLAAAQTASTVATGLGTIAMNIFTTALIATGVGALVVALGALVAYFTRTAEGAKMVKVALAEVKAVVNVLIDRFSSVGEGLVKLFSGDWKGAATAFKNAFVGIGEELVNDAKHAGELQRQTNALNKEIRDNIVIQQERLTKSAQLRNDAKQEGVTAEEKKKMLNEAKGLLIEYYNEEKSIASKEYEIFKAKLGDHKAMGDELTKQQELKARVLQVDEESAQAQKALSREMKGANKEIAAQTAEILKKAEAQRKIDKEQTDKLRGLKTEELRKMPADSKKEKEDKADQDERTNLFNKNLDKLSDKQDNVWRKTKKEIGETKTAYLDLSDSLNSGMSQMGEGIGEFMGALMSGQGGVQSFGTMVAGIFADMAINVGKMAISTGLAVFGIKAALKSLNPAVAIAAGVALVALGSAIKGRLSSMASGGTSSAVSEGGQNFNFDTRSNTPTQQAQNINVNITGTLNASPKGLTTTLNKENTRVSLAT